MKDKINIGQLLFLIFSFFVMWGMFAGNFYNDDYFYYESEFDAGDFSRLEELNIEPLYTYLIYYTKLLFNFKDYVEFKAVISFFFMIPYWYTIARWSEKPSWTVLVFAPIFLLQIIIVRNFLGFAIMSLAIPLLSDPRRKNLILFFILILVAEGFHNMMFVYLLCYLSVIDIKLFKRPVMYYAVCVAIGVLLGGFAYSFWTGASSKYNDINDEGINYLRMVFGVLLLVNYYVLKYIKTHTRDSNNSNVARFEEYILRLNVIFIGLTIVFAVSVVAIRLFVNLLLFNTIFVVNRLSRKEKTGPAVPVSLGYLAFWIYYVVVITLSVQLEEVFKYNYFILRLFA